MKRTRYHEGMDPLARLFGSPERLKIMRFFLFNPKTPIGALDLSHALNANPKTVQKEVLNLLGARFLKKRNFYRTETIRKKGNFVERKERVRGWILDDRFAHLPQLKQLLIESRAFQHDTIVDRFRNVGRIKLLLVSGVFIQNPEASVDLLVVGDGLRKALIRRIIRAIETEIGKELRYSVMNSDEFVYRQGIYDKFLRDILDYPHERLVDKIGLR